MITVSKVISTNYTEGARNRVVKVLGRGAIINGRGDTKEAKESGPFGMDSNPTNGKVALFQKSEVYGKYYIVGYLNTQQKSEVGETRLFCTDADGQFKFNLWLRADGAVLIGDSDTPSEYTNFATKFNELQAGFEAFKADYNTFITSVFNAHVHTGVTTGAGSSAVTPTQGTPTTASIDDAKNETVKFK